MILIAGLALIALGLLCGAVLVVAPFGLSAASEGATLWVLFPLFVVAGYALFTVPAGSGRLRTVSRIAGASLLLLALGAALGLVAVATALARADTASLWYVLTLGLVLGATALTAHAGPDTRS